MKRAPHGASGGALWNAASEGEKDEGACHVSSHKMYTRKRAPWLSHAGTHTCTCIPGDV